MSEIDYKLLYEETLKICERLQVEKEELYWRLQDKEQGKRGWALDTNKICPKCFYRDLVSRGDIFGSKKCKRCGFVIHKDKRIRPLF